MIARRPSLLAHTAPLTLTMALIAASLASPAMARTRSAPATQSIETALTKGEGNKGISLAEAAVAQSPREAALRATLGRTYLKNGRFQSASTALSDAVTLGDNSGRTLLTLALAQIGSGQNDAALRTLNMGNSVIPVADLGLALALAGEGEKGAVLLGDALRAGDKSEKLRANLGYAYALSGRWAEARTIVAMDLPADKVDERMTEWAQAARPEASRQRVASLLNVGLVDDAGQPMQLALNKSESPAQMAAAEPAPMPVPMAVAAAAPAATYQAPAPAAELPSNELPVGDAAPVQAAYQAPQAELPAVAAPEPVAAPAPVFHAIAMPAPRAPVMAVRSPSPNPRVKVKAKAAPVETAAVETRVASGSHVVQLGAFLSEGNAVSAKKAFLRREKAFADADVVISKAMVDERQFWRVSVRGFSANSATSKCASIRKGGGTCFAHAGNLPSGNQGRALAMATPKR